jgi:poly(3-hydroxyalkanoate) depolymerase
VLAIAGQRIRIHVREGRDESGPPLLICNGLGVNLETLDPLVGALGDHTVIRFDAPGTGESSTPLLPYGIPHVAGLVAAVLERLGHPQADVIGISWGGAIAQQFALSHPDRCRRLILAATTTGVLSIPGHPLSVALALSPLHWVGARLIGSDAGIVFGGDFRRDGRARPNRMPGFRPPSPLGLYWQLLALWGWTSVHQLRHIRQPVLLLAGEDDPLVPLANARMMLRLLPDARLQTFDCGHLFTLTRAAAVAHAIADFTR